MAKRKKRKRGSAKSGGGASGGAAPSWPPPAPTEAPATQDAAPVEPEIPPEPFVVEPGPWEQGEPTPGQIARGAELVRLATLEFGELKGGEEEMLRAAGEGRVADLTTVDEWFEEHEQRPLTPVREFPNAKRLWWDVQGQRGPRWGCWENWGEHRKIRAEVLRWLCASDDAAELIDPNGIALMHALVVGRVELDEARIRSRIMLGWCALPAGLSMLGASARTISLHGCWCGSDAENDGYAIAADRLTTTGNVFFCTGFRSRGEVRLLGAEIGGVLECSGADMDCARDASGTPVGEPFTLTADGVTVKGGVFLRDGFRSRGMIRLPGARIGGDLDTSGATLAPSGSDHDVGMYAMWLGGAMVKGRLLLQHTNVEDVARFDCTGARVGRLQDDEKSWGDAPLLTGFAYDAVHNASLRDVDWRLDWLAKSDATAKAIARKNEQNDGHKRERGDQLPDPQPYRQLAKVMREQGHERDGRRVMRTLRTRQRKAWFRRAWPGWGRAWSNAWPTAKRTAWRVWQGDAEIARRERQKQPLPDFGFVHEDFVPTKMSWLRRVWIVVECFFWWCFWAIAGYGYSRFRPLPWMIGFIVLGAFLFGGNRPFAAFAENNNPPEMRRTQGVALRAETGEDGTGSTWLNDYPAFRPLAYSADAFLPLVNLHQESYWTPRDGWIKRFYLPFHIVMGWLVTTLFAVSLTGLVRQDKE